MAVRIIGLYLIAQGILELPNLFFLVQFPEGQELSPVLRILHTSAILAPIIMGIMVLAFSSVIASMIYSVPSDNGREDQISMIGLESLGFAILGLVIIFISFPELSSASIAIYQNNSISDRPVNYFLTPEFISPLVGIILGFVLFVGVKFWVRLYGLFKGFVLAGK